MVKSTLKKAHLCLSVMENNFFRINYPAITYGIPFFTVIINPFLVAK